MKNRDKNKRYKVRYRGCYKGPMEKPDPNDPKVGQIVLMSLETILREINCHRSSGWTDYDETDWREGLDEWTWYEPLD